MNNLIKSTLAASSLVVFTCLSTAASAAPLTFAVLALTNGWERYSTSLRAPSAALDSENVVHLRGAIDQGSGSNSTAFVLPPNLRPSRTVYVPVDMVSGTTGRLAILQDGTVFVVATGSQSNAQSFTSLEGVIFSRN